VLCTIAVADAE